MSTSLPKAERRAPPLSPLDKGVIRSEEAAAVRRALAELPADYQEVIRLRVLLDMPTPSKPA